ncbi:putative alpha,alpha-trehalose-phosphate synthase (UDP-forming) [Helianthus anomalus]
MTLPGIINGCDGDSDTISSACRERKIIVTNMLPLHIQRDPDTLKLTFRFDEDLLYWQLKQGFCDTPGKPCNLTSFLSEYVPNFGTKFLSSWG